MVKFSKDQGKFSIYPVETIDQGIEILTGTPAKKIHKLVDQRLRSFAEMRRDFSRAQEENDTDRKQQKSEPIA